MNFNQLNIKFEAENLVLRPVLEGDRAFIYEMFNDGEIKRYYLVPKEAQKDYRNLIDYWINDVRNGVGNCWIIHQRRTGIFSKKKPVGFIAFEFRDSLKKASISYAILPNKLQG